LRLPDGKPPAQSRKVQAYHGFGDAELAFGGAAGTVAREAVIAR